MSRDEELCEHLTRSGVEWTRLDASSHAEAEHTWRETYGGAFVKSPRLRRGAKAEHAYQQEACTRYLMVPFTSNVAGLPIHVIHHSPNLGAYECRGVVVPLGVFHETEFFVCPTDFAWTMVHTHEGHGIGNPFFVRQEWLS